MRIVFSRNTSPLSRLIQKVTKGKWSHNTIMLDDNHILDSRFPKGVQIRHFDLKDYEIVEVNGDINKAKKHIEKHYDVLLFMSYIFKGKRWNNPNKMICSELVASALNDGLLKEMTPNEQYHYLKNR